MNRARKIAIITLWTLTAVMGQAQAPRAIVKTPTTVSVKA